MKEKNLNQSIKIKTGTGIETNIEALRRKKAQVILQNLGDILGLLQERKTGKIEIRTKIKIERKKTEKRKTRKVKVERIVKKMKRKKLKKRRG